MSLGYSTIAVTAPQPENLVSVFDFVLRGLDALHYQQHLDYTIGYNHATGRDATKCVLSVSIHRSHRQVIHYLPPSEPDKFVSRRTRGHRRSRRHSLSPWCDNSSWATPKTAPAVAAVAVAVVDPPWTGLCF